MSAKYLGDTFDIHGGGQDLIFPHHENEIAQSCCATGNDFYARYWVHNGHLMVNGEKMSKSLGNFFTVHEILDKVPGEAIRLYVLSTHYHQPLNWTDDGLKQARQTMDRLYTALRGTPDVSLENVEPDNALMDALQDDLNTPLAISCLHAMATTLNKASSESEKIEAKQKLLVSAQVMGLLLKTPEEWFKGAVKEDELSEQEILEMIQKRADARKNRDFATADLLRKTLADKGVLIEDTPTGTQWKRA